MGTQEEDAARLVWQYGEPIHAVLFFAPETRAATEELGLKGGWMSYLGSRAAQLGAVPAAVVTSIFYGFHPRMVERAIPDAWTYAEPRLVTALVAGVTSGELPLARPDEAVTHVLAAKGTDPCTAEIER